MLIFFFLDVVRILKYVDVVVVIEMVVRSLSRKNYNNHEK